MRRREFITLLAGAGRRGRRGAAQQRERVRRIGVLMNRRGRCGVASRLLFFCRDCRNWAGPTAATCGWSTLGPQRRRLRRKVAAELVALAPEVILANGAGGGRTLQRATRTLPVVFVIVPIRSLPGMSPAWRGRVETPPDSPARIQNRREMAELSSRSRRE